MMAIDATAAILTKKATEMGSNRFAAMANATIFQTNRRLTLSALLGGAVGLLRLVDGSAAKSGTCKPSCNACSTCQKGKCKKKHGKKKCKKGTCQPRPDGIGCGSTPCQACQGGVCVNTANDTLCQGTGRCLNGICNPQPVCAPYGAGCSTADPGTCCSDACIVTGMMVAACSFGAPGQECIAGTDCASGSCVGFRCL